MMFGDIFCALFDHAFVAAGVGEDGAPFELCRWCGVKRWHFRTPCPDEVERP